MNFEYDESSDEVIVDFGHGTKRVECYVNANLLLDRNRLRAENSWQDIASAPKTGEWMLAARKHCLLPGIVKWDQDYGCFENGDGDHIYNLTHWRPLPRIPGNEGEK